MIITQPQDTRYRCDSCKIEWNSSNFEHLNTGNLLPETKLPQRITMGYLNCGPGGIAHQYDLCGECLYKALTFLGVIKGNNRAI